MITYSTSPGSSPARSSAARMTIEPSSVAGYDPRPPPRRPNGVRTAETMTARLTKPAYLSPAGTLAHMRVLVVDNYDSFTYNLVHLLEELGADVVVRLSDKLTVNGARSRPDGLVVSTGPRPPLDGVAPRARPHARLTIPTLGVCLGHQAIVEAFGGDRAGRELVHGKASRIEHDGRGVFAGLPDEIEVGRYHSLAATRVPEELDVTSRTEDGEVMGVRHRTQPIEGVQFHPESVLTPDGPTMLRTFLDSLRSES